MDECNTLGTEEHKLLRELGTHATRKGVIDARGGLDGLLQGVNRWHLETLIDCGFVDRIRPGTLAVRSRCNCGVRLDNLGDNSGGSDSNRGSGVEEVAADTRRAIRRIGKQPAEDPSEPSKVIRRIRKLPSSGVGSDADHIGSPERRTRRSRASSSPIGLGEHAIATDSTNSYIEKRETAKQPRGQSAAKRVSGRRVSTEVARAMARRNTPDGWQDKPVDRWNATDMAGYFNAKSWEICRGKSPDRFSFKPMLAHFARMRREGVTPVDIKTMIDRFLGQLAAEPGTVDSTWRLFIRRRGQLAKDLTTNAGVHYTNQPVSADEGDEEGRWF